VQRAYTAAQSALLEAKPTTLDGYFTKWRTFLHSERELEMDNLDFLAFLLSRNVANWRIFFRPSNLQRRYPRRDHGALRLG